jgi:hypothetical protein
MVDLTQKDNVSKSPAIGSLLQAPAKQLHEECIQELNCGINHLLEKLKADLKKDGLDAKEFAHSIAREQLGLHRRPFSQRYQSRPTLSLPSPEAYRPLLDLFEKLEQQFGSEAYADPKGQSLQSSKALLCDLSAHAKARHHLEDLPPPQQHSDSFKSQRESGENEAQSTAKAVLAALQDNTLPAELRQITVSGFANKISYSLLLPREVISRLLWSIVDPMTPEDAATFLGNMPGTLDNLIRGVDFREMFNKLLSIANKHPHAQNRASLLAQLVETIHSRKVWPVKEEALTKILEIIGHLPDKDEARLNLRDALKFLLALSSASDQLTRNDVKAAAKRIVESTAPLPADEADGLQAWIRLNLRQPNVDELTRLVPRQQEV